MYCCICYLLFRDTDIALMTCRCSLGPDAAEH
jgi:hypothetical protein